MNRLPEQKELIRRLREAYADKNLSLNKIIDMMPEDDRKLGKTTCQRLFNREDAESLNFDYNTLILLSEMLLDSDEEDDEARLKYKKKVIEVLEEKIHGLEQMLAFRSERIRTLDATIVHLRKQNEALTGIIDKLTGGNNEH